MVEPYGFDPVLLIVDNTETNQEDEKDLMRRFDYLLPPTKNENEEAKWPPLKSMRDFILRRVLDCYGRVIN